MCHLYHVTLLELGSTPRLTSGQVSQRLTKLEVKLADAESDATRLRERNEVLERDCEEMIDLKLEIAEAKVRIEQLESFGD